MSNIADTPALTALFHVGHRLPLPGGFWLEKSSEDRWQVGGPMAGTPDVYWAMNISTNVPVGKDGSADVEMLELSIVLCKAAGIDWEAVSFPDKNQRRVRPLLSRSERDDQ